MLYKIHNSFENHFTLVFSQVSSKLKGRKEPFANKYTVGTLISILNNIYNGHIRWLKIKNNGSIESVDYLL